MNEKVTAVEPLKKITVKDVVGPLTVPDAHTLLLYVYGVCTSAQEKPTKHNPKQKLLMGRFKAVRISDRKEFSSERLYLPDDAYQEQIAKAAAPNLETGEIPEIEFGFMIGYKAGSSPTGYVWTCEPMTDTQTQDRLSRLESTIVTNKLLARFNLPALPSPDKPGKTK